MANQSRPYHPAFDMPATAEQALAWVTKQGDPLCMTFSPKHAKAAAELLAARIEYLEVAVAQAVEFATYVEQAAKGTMVERARHFMSQEFAQELAARLQQLTMPVDDSHLTDVEREVLKAAEEVRLAVRYSARVPTTAFDAEAKMTRIRAAKRRMLVALGVPNG